MSQEKMIEIIKKAIADADFRARLAENPGDILKDYDLSPQDIEIIRQGMGGEALDALSAMLDERISRARLPMDDLMNAFEGLTQDASEILHEPGSIPDPQSEAADDLLPFPESETGDLGDSYDPAKQYVGVQLEHGEVLVDDDWNEPPAESKMEGLDDDDVIDRPEPMEGEFEPISPFDDQAPAELESETSDVESLRRQTEIDHMDQETRSASSVVDEDDLDSTEDEFVKNIK
jgi:hypothetical protein